MKRDNLSTITRFTGIIVIFLIIYYIAIKKLNIVNISNTNRVFIITLLFILLLILIIAILIYITMKNSHKTYEGVFKLNKKIEENESLYQAEGKLTKELVYKSINRNNLNIIVKDMEILLANNSYLLNLVNISEKLKIKGLFNEEINKIVFTSYTFIKQFKKNFYYNDTIIEMSENVILKMNQVLENYDSTIIKQLYKEVENLTGKFLKYNSNFNKDILLENQRIKSIQALWIKLLENSTDKNNMLNEKVSYILNVGPKKQITCQDLEYMSFVIDSKNFFQRLYSSKNSDNKIENFLNTNVGFKNKIITDFKEENNVIEKTKFLYKIYQNIYKGTNSNILDKDYLKEIIEENSYQNNSITKQMEYKMFDTINQKQHSNSSSQKIELEEYLYF